MAVYNAGHLMGAWVSLPIEHDDFRALELVSKALNHNRSSITEYYLNRSH